MVITFRRQRDFRKRKNRIFKKTFNNLSELAKFLYISNGIYCCNLENELTGNQLDILYWKLNSLSNK